jgi:hypothetical protein
MPEGAVYVGRPTRWGNPFKISAQCTAAECVAHYRQTWEDYLANEPRGAERLRLNLGGKDLACWCPIDQPCHADVLLDLANRGVGQSTTDRK